MIPHSPKVSALPSVVMTRRPGRIRRLDHVAVCVEGGSLAEYADYYGAAFGMDRYSAEYVAVGGVIDRGGGVADCAGQDGCLAGVAHPDPA